MTASRIDDYKEAIKCLQSGKLEINSSENFRCASAARIPCHGCKWAATAEHLSRCPGVPTEYWSNIIQHIKPQYPEYFI